MPKKRNLGGDDSDEDAALDAIAAQPIERDGGSDGEDEDRELLDSNVRAERSSSSSSSQSSSAAEEEGGGGEKKRKPREGKKKKKKQGGGGDSAGGRSQAAGALYRPIFPTAFFAILFVMMHAGMVVSMALASETIVNMSLLIAIYAVLAVIESISIGMYVVCHFNAAKRHAKAHPHQHQPQQPQSIPLLFDMGKTIAMPDRNKRAHKGLLERFFAWSDVRSQLINFALSFLSYSAVFYVACAGINAVLTENASAAAASGGSNGDVAPLTIDVIVIRMLRMVDPKTGIRVYSIAMLTMLAFQTCISIVTVCLSVAVSSYLKRCTDDFVVHLLRQNRDMKRSIKQKEEEVENVRVSNQILKQQQLAAAGDVEEEHQRPMAAAVGDAPTPYRQQPQQPYGNLLNNIVEPIVASYANNGSYTLDFSRSSAPPQIDLYPSAR
jgi:hypothetical protein